MLYRCPLCHTPLEKQADSLRCTQQHSFDFARSGYVNLLSVQHKNSRQPGDDALSVQARREFLAQGFYAPLREALCKHLHNRETSAQGHKLLDIGCNEGYYTGYLAKHLNEHQIWGMDISKPAIQAAAKAYPEVEFAVGSAYKLPYQDAVFTEILSVFAPLEPYEAQRVLHKQGSLLRALPGPEHLYAIKDLLYPQARLHEVPAAIDSWKLVERERVRYDFAIQQARDLLTLISMTPYAWRLQRIEPSDLQRALPVKVEVDVYLEQWQPPE